MVRRSDSDPGSHLMPVAAYLRASTDLQQYSLANQDEAIQTYARQHRMAIVRIYQDEGQSGLTVDRRTGLQALLRVIESGNPEFQGVLVLDVSRWGRFQNLDEAAYYEFRCWKAGIRVFYVHELFANDGTPFSMLFKSLKRAMAAEYSREQSAKVSAGHRRGARQGYHQGSLAGYGLRRLLIAANGEPRTILAAGERKYLATDRVLLVPGPPDEVRAVRWMFEDYLAGHGCSAIAQALNAQGLRTHTGTPWSYSTVRNILDAEKYAGVNVYDRRSRKLKAPVTLNPAPDWVRHAAAFEPVVTPELFAAVQARRRQMRQNRVARPGVREGHATRDKAGAP